MTPVIGADFAGVDVRRFNRIDVAEHLLDLGPTFDLQQDVAARTHEGQRLIRLAGLDGAHNVDSRDDRAEVVGRPTDEGEDAARRKGEDATTAIEDLFARFAAEPDPVLDALLYPGQFDVSEHVGALRDRHGAAAHAGAALLVMMDLQSSRGIRAREGHAACWRR